jgi:PAS domain S-box-containing protein
MMEEINKLRKLTETLTGNGYLRDRAAEWEYALNAFPDCVFITNTENKIRFVNDALLERLNQTKGAIYGKDCFEVFNHTGCSDACKLENGKEEEFFIGNLHGWFTYSRSKIETKMGKLLGYIVVLRDVTALHLSEEKLRTIIEHTDELFYIHGTDHVVTYVSPTCYDLLGYTVDEMKQDWTNMVTDHPLNKIGIEKTEKAIETGKKQPPYLLEFIKKDGSFVFLEVNESPVKDSEGNVIGIAGAARDVTAHIEAEEELRKERDLSQKYLDVSGVIFVALDKDKKVTMINKKGCELLGYEEEEILGKDWIENFIRPINGFKVSKIFERVINNDGTSTAENMVVSKSGEVRIIKWHNSNILDNDGNVVGTLSSGHDVTEKRKQEKLLAEAKENFKQELKDFVINTARAKILIIEDEENIVTLLDTFLEEEGYKTFTAMDGQKALESFYKNKPDLVVVDLTIPKISGIDVIKEINKNFPCTPILVLSGTELTEDVDAALRAGAWYYAKKPMDMRIFKRAVSRLLDHGRYIKECKMLNKYLDEN